MMHKLWHLIYGNLATLVFHRGQNLEMKKSESLSPLLISQESERARGAVETKKKVNEPSWRKEQFRATAVRLLISICASGLHEFLRDSLQFRVRMCIMDRLVTFQSVWWFQVRCGDEGFGMFVNVWGREVWMVECRSGGKEPAFVCVCVNCFS